MNTQTRFVYLVATLLAVCTASSAFADDLAVLQADCDAGKARSCDDLGSAYLFGTGVEKDGARAVTFFAKACDLGEGFSCTNAAMTYEFGEGVPVDLALAAAFNAKACENGHPKGCFKAGVAYAEGKGVPQDLPKAIAAFQKDCDIGNTKSCDAIQDIRKKHPELAP